VPTETPPRRRFVAHPREDGGEPVRRLVIVLGDQLDPESEALRDFDPSVDLVWMAELAEEAEHVPSHRARTALFLAAMRRFRDALRARGTPVRYRALDDPEPRPRGFSEALALDLPALRPREITVAEPGDFRVARSLRAAAAAARVPLHVRPDRTFLADAAFFTAFAAGKKRLRLEDFYRRLRRRTGVLMDGPEPVGGRWNFDAENRKSFGRSGPPALTPPQSFPPDRSTRDVLQLVRRRFPDHPGSLDAFDWPVGRREARAALDDFIAHRLPEFGRYQDAMWGGEPWLYHSRLSAALNLKLLTPRETIDAAVAAYEEGRAPLASVEGFVRQILGWREFVRGYWRLRGEELLRENALDAHEPLPAFYWTGNTRMACVADAVGQTLRLGYAHHIQRLMVTGLFSLLLGVEPARIHEWYLAIYVDAVEWVEAPNVLGMSQFADGGGMSSKPYVASGRYLERMSDACRRCPFDPGEAVGSRACPFTTLYRDFLLRHGARFRDDPRLGFQVRQVAGLPADARAAAQAAAETLRARLRRGEDVAV
jgi:deoxyribodipyrimidine photolyase-related protein